MDFTKITNKNFDNYLNYFNNQLLQLNEFRRLIFSIKTYMKYEVKDIRTTIKIAENTHTDILNLYELIFTNKDYKSEYKLLKKNLNNDLYLLIKFSSENNIFFDRCSDVVYLNTFENRFNEYKTKYFNENLKNFFEHEIANNNCLYELEYSFMFNKENKKILSIFNQNKREYWKKLTQKDNKEIEEIINYDLSDNSATEKIIYLQKLGVIDFLRTKKPFNTSINSLATILSAVTGTKNTTIQPMLNAMLGNNVEQKNNPLKSQKPLNKVNNQLIQIGFNLNETN